MKLVKFPFAAFSSSSSHPHPHSHTSAPVVTLVLPVLLEIQQVLSAPLQPNDYLQRQARSNAMMSTVPAQ